MAQTFQNKASGDYILASRGKALPNSSSLIQCREGPCAVPSCAGDAAGVRALLPAAAQGGTDPSAAAAAEARRNVGDRHSCRNRAARHATGSATTALDQGSHQGRRWGKRGVRCLGIPRGASGTTLEMMVRTETQVGGIRGVWEWQNTQMIFFREGSKRPECHRPRIRPEVGVC